MENARQQIKEYHILQPVNNTGSTRNSSWVEDTLLNTSWIGDSLQSDSNNNSFWNITLTLEDEEELGFFMANIHLLKAIVLGVVVIILILSACRFVLQLFSRYHDDGTAGKHDGEMGYFE